MKNKFVSIGIVFIMLVSTVSMLLTIAPELVTPQDEPELSSHTSVYFSGVEKTWDAGAAGDASGPANWDPVGVPDTGDNVTFDGTSVYDCDWDVEVTLGDFSMLTGYTGTVTQTASFSCVDFLFQQGTFTPGSTPLSITVNGNFTKVAPALWTAFRSFHLILDNSIVTTNSDIWAGRLFLNGTITMNGNLASNAHITIYSGTTVTIASGIYLYVSLIDYANFDSSGIIQGDGKVTFNTGDLDITMPLASKLGTINCDTLIQKQGGGTRSVTFTLADSLSFGGTVTVASASVTWLTTLTHGNDYELDVTGDVTLGTRGIITQGTGAWSFGSYAQTGVSSVFNQGATLTIGTDFTVSDGIFNAVGDMTVPGDWDTATGDYVNDDNVVTLTGASKTLAMHADDSFFNVTVSGSYTMNTDTTVRLRATISGTVDGTGDFIEPLPEFTSEDLGVTCPEELYEYEITQTYWDELAIVDGPYWLHLIDESVMGIPPENQTGIHYISLSLTWNDMVVYQNYTLIVCADTEPFISLEMIMCLLALLILLAINIVGACIPRVRILNLVGIFGIVIIALPASMILIDYPWIAFILIFANLMIPVMSIVNNIKDK